MVAAASEHATRVLGLGSPHGDDHMGWWCAEYLAGVLPAQVLVRSLGQPLQLLDYLDGCRQLVLIDACRGSAHRGTVCRLTWPDPRIARWTLTSSHQMGLAESLQLAGTLRRLPPRIVVIGVELGDASEGLDAAPLFERVAPEVERLVREEIRESSVA